MTLRIVNVFAKLRGLWYVLPHTSRGLRYSQRGNSDAEKLATAVLALPSIVEFGNIPIKALRENSVTELDLSEKRIGVPEALMLSGLLAGALSLVKLKCAVMPCAALPPCTQFGF